MKSRTMIIASLVLLPLAACGGDDKKSEETTGPAADVVVDAGPGLKFDATEYTATAGDVSIELVQRDTQLHSLAVIDAESKQVGALLEVGKSGEVDDGTYPLEAGTYDLICLVPGHSDMRATLNVS